MDTWPSGLEKSIELNLACEIGFDLSTATLLWAATAGVLLLSLSASACRS
jgi:hypothetical protein